MGTQELSPGGVASRGTAGGFILFRGGGDFDHWKNLGGKTKPIAMEMARLGTGRCTVCHACNLQAVCRDHSAILWAVRPGHQRGDSDANTDASDALDTHRIYDDANPENR